MNVDKCYRRYAAALLRAAAIGLSRKRRTRALMWARIYAGALFKIGALR